MSVLFHVFIFLSFGDEEVKGPAGQGGCTG